MTFQHREGRPRIAVVGGGISGLGAAWLLSGRADVTLLEAEGRLGGHARTVLAGRRGDQPVDTGFIVYNEVNYPNLTALFHELAVPTAPSDMSFGASLDGGRVEYALASYDAIFAQRRNLARPRFLRMLRDIVRFNEGAEAAVRPGMPVRELAAALGLGREFLDWYLTPFSGAIWSTPAAGILDFPADAMVRFFRNHALLAYDGQHRWRTVRGGSREYVSRLEAALLGRGVDIRLSCAPQAVRRGAMGPELRMGGDWRAFDEIVLACHSDQSLRLLGAAAPEAADLGAIRYQPNRMQLHADPSVMPRRRKCWSSWNYVGPSGGGGAIPLSYWMNSLQPIPADDPMFVTLNDPGTIDPALVYDEAMFDHPVFDTAAWAAQARLNAGNGAGGVWLAGAWLGNGFHEDGLASAVRVAEGIEARRALAVAAA
ncbi:MAG: NAD(P)/FAD-dependent oxidoreductase [Hasllibacter sp.]